eukprot:2942188-Pleurochrysis_carterae.AAC.2
MGHPVCVWQNGVPQSMQRAACSNDDGVKDTTTQIVVIYTVTAAFSKLGCASSGKCLPVHSML